MTQIYRPSGGGGGASAPAEGRAKPSGGTADYSIPGVDIVSVSTAGGNINLIRYFPIYVASSISVDQIACEVTTNVASQTCRLGLYQADTDWQPTTRLADSGALDCATTGIKTASLGLTLAAGRYLMCINMSSGSLAFRVWRGGGRYTGLISTLGNTLVQAMYKNLTYAAFTDPGTAWDTLATSTTPLDYYCVLRVSTP